MNNCNEILNYIEQYESEREPDLILQCEFKNGVRIQPVLESYHSTNDFKKWLNNKKQAEILPEAANIDENQYLKIYDEVISDTLVRYSGDLNLIKGSSKLINEWIYYAQNLKISLFKANDGFNTWVSCLINDKTIEHGTFMGTGDTPLIAICEMANKMGYFPTESKGRFSKFIENFIEKKGVKND